jgi:hypothetical protein
VYRCGMWCDEDLVMFAKSESEGAYLSRIFVCIK